MTMTTFPPEVASAVSAVVAGAGALDLSSATPCADFDLKALINHVIGTTAALARVGRREPLDPTDPYGEHTDASGGDWPRSAGQQPRWARPGMGRAAGLGGVSRHGEPDHACPDDR